MSTSKARILIVEDKFIVAEDLATTLRRLGYEVVDLVMSGEEGIERTRELQPDLVLMDIRLQGDIDGIQAADQIKKRFGIPVVYLTAHSDDSTLHRASATQPLGYLLKPFEERQLYTTIELALNRRTQDRRKESELLPRSGALGSGTPARVRALPEFRHIVGEHPALLSVLERVELVAKTDVAVHVYGENGTGKELIADAVHRLSARREQRFVKLNCSAIPPTLLESALFGHTKGSFTGASRDQEGFVEHAEGGTLFLDEIADISPEIQVKLLRLLQTREFTKIGDTEIRTANIRIITATNQNLKDLVGSGKIREDFFYRIHVFPIVVPPLRNRGDDVMLLADHFRVLFAGTFGKTLPAFSPAAKSILIAHTWPGNIRELENAIRHAFVIAPEGSVIEPVHLPPDVLEGARTSAALRGEEDPIGALSADERERQSIIRALDEAGGSKTKAAKLLGYSRVTLWKKMSKLGMMPEGHAGDSSEAEE